MTTDTGLSSVAVAETAGVSLVTLHRWVEAGIVSPSIHRGRGTGNHHQWSDRDVLVLAAIHRTLTDLGAAGIDQPVGRSLVRRLWTGLLAEGHVTVRHGTVCIHAYLNRADTCTHPADQHVVYPEPTGVVCARCGSALDRSIDIPIRRGLEDE